MAQPAVAVPELDRLQDSPRWILLPAETAGVVAMKPARGCCSCMGAASSPAGLQGRVAPINLLAHLCHEIQLSTAAAGHIQLGTAVMRMPATTAYCSEQPYKPYYHRSTTIAAIDKLHRRACITSKHACVTNKQAQTTSAPLGGEWCPHLGSSAARFDSAIPQCELLASETSRVQCQERQKC